MNVASSELETYVVLISGRPDDCVRQSGLTLDDNNEVMNMVGKCRRSSMEFQKALKTCQLHIYLALIEANFATFYCSYLSMIHSNSMYLSKKKIRIIVIIDTLICFLVNLLHYNFLLYLLLLYHLHYGCTSTIPTFVSPFISLYG